MNKMMIDWKSDDAIAQAYASGVACYKLGYSIKANPFGWYNVGGVIEVSSGMQKHFDNWCKGWSVAQATVLSGKAL